MSNLSPNGNGIPIGLQAVILIGSGLVGVPMVFSMGGLGGILGGIVGLLVLGGVTTALVTPKAKSCPDCCASLPRAKVCRYRKCPFPEQWPKQKRLLNLEARIGLLRDQMTERRNGWSDRDNDLACKELLRLARLAKDAERVS